MAGFERGLRYESENGGRGFGGYSMLGLFVWIFPIFSFNTLFLPAWLVSWRRGRKCNLYVSKRMCRGKTNTGSANVWASPENKTRNCLKLVLVRWMLDFLVFVRVSLRRLGEDKDEHGDEDDKVTR